MTKFASSATTLTEELRKHATKIKDRSGSQLIASRDHSLPYRHDFDGLYVDWGYQRVTDETLRLLISYASQQELILRLHDQFRGESVNKTENRSVLHTMLRGTHEGIDPLTLNTMTDQLDRMYDFATQIRSGAIRSHSDGLYTDILHIGIGGSHLGVEFLYTALSSPKIPVHFLSNVDPSHVRSVLANLNPKTTLVIVASKSMRTPETLRNCEIVKSWFNGGINEDDAFSRHCVSISASTSPALSDARFRFHIPDSIGGRFSIWSAMCLPLVISHGSSTLRELHNGAREIDQLTLDSPPEENMALILALLAFWNIRFLDVKSHVIGIYAHQLALLLPYLQQLELESNGKSVDIDGLPTQFSTTVPTWGGVETNGQHAWHQFLHQGTSQFSVDFVSTSQDCKDPNGVWHLANCLAQRSLLFHGHQTSKTESHKIVKGCHPCNLLLLDTIDAKNIGRLLALYEHKVSLLGLLWRINSFDQFGVEHGKLLSETFRLAIETGQTHNLHVIDQELINTIRLRVET